MQLSRLALVGLAALPLFATDVSAQVHYFEDGRPWKNKARKGPDAEVPGWFYNLGITGLRVELMPEEPKHLLVRHVFERSPAWGRIKAGDVLVGIEGKPFREEHQNGYGMKVFGAQGPIGEFGMALERAQTKGGKGQLEVTLRRASNDEDNTPQTGKRLDVTLKIGRKYGAFADTFPTDCDKSDRIFKELCAWLVENQRDNGSFGNPVHNLFAPLALLASGESKYRKAVKRCAQFHAQSTTSKNDGSGLVNWKYMTAGIVLSEYYLATKEKWVLTELQEIYDFISWTQYTDRSQINPKTYESHPGSVSQKEDDRRKMGGWGHNPGFEGYGPIAMITGEGAIAFALMNRCGIQVDRERHEMAYDFLERGTGKNGYVWYADDSAGDQNWADPGRTGAAGVANFIAPFAKTAHRKQGLRHARVIGDHPESFPDTHGSPVLGMGWAAAAASFDAKSYRKLMDANRFWFALAQCHDGTYYYQPNRDNAGYGNDSRMNASSVTAFLLAIPRKNLHVTGKPFAN